MLMGALSLAAMVFVACGEGDSDGSRNAGSSEARSSPSEEDPQAFVRACTGSAVENPLGPPTSSDLVAGDVVFRNLQAYRSTRERGTLNAGEQLQGQWRFFKVLVTIREGEEALVSVPPKDRDAFLLGYDPSNFRGSGPGGIEFFRSDGQAAVRFGQCGNASPEGVSEFNGGVLVRRPGCFHMRIESGGETVTKLVNIAKGAGGCGEARAQ